MVECLSLVSDGMGEVPYNVSNDPNKVIELKVNLSKKATDFLNDLGPLDAQGWAMVGRLPVEHWPSAEIIEAMYKNDQLRAFIPVDIVGMLTDLNPGRLYF